MRLRTAVVAAACVVAALTVPASAQRPAARNFTPGEILVKFRPGTSAGRQSDAHRAAGGTRLAEIARTGVQRVRVRAGDEAGALARYQRNPNVVIAEPNFLRSIPAPTSHGGGSEVVAGDAYFAEQWALYNTGQPFYCLSWFGGELCLYSGAVDADIDAPEAWAISTGSSAVTVAVIDSGIDYTHPDLAPNYVGGYDFVFSDTDPADDHGHGTHVAGTIAAAMNNPTGSPALPEGVAGVAPNARVRAYKVCRSDGSCDDFAIQQAIARAIADGANVVNMSLGGSEYSQSLDDAVQDAWNAGLVVVAGAGNDGTTAPFYPAALDNVISVAAFDEDHRRPSFSNYGSWVDVSAPGATILSTYLMSACGASAAPGETGCYTWQSGTSMATPHVAGAAALVWSRVDVTRNSHVVDVLLGSADPNGVAASQPLDAWTVHGGLNLHSALSYHSTGPRADAGDDQIVIDDGGDGTELVRLDATASSDPDGGIVSYAWRRGTTPVATGATPDVELGVGMHVLTLAVTAADGDVATDEMIVTVYPSAPVTVTASAPRATEAGSAIGTFTVSRAGNSSAPLTVHYVLGGTAVAGSDYVALPGAVTIDAGASAATIAVTPIDDAAYEGDEAVVLTLTPDNAYSLAFPTEGTVIIVSDDLPPDLVVSSVTAPAAGGADADIAVTDSTTNQGGGSSPAFETGFYLSTNTTLDAADVFLGSRPVAMLGQATTETRTTTLHVPPSTAAGSYHILAKADQADTVLESVETNNVKASGAIKIGPDIVITAVAGPASAAAGSIVSVSDTTKNQGSGGAEASTTRFYLSANSLFDAADVILGGRPVPFLAPGASSAATTALTLPGGLAAGTYYVIAQADTANSVSETIEINNNRSSSALRIGADLVLTAVGIPSIAAAGGTITVTDTTKNQGAGTAPATSTGFYLSANATMNSTDIFLGSRAVGELGPGVAATGSVSLQVPLGTAPGSYYVIGAADWNALVTESVETNNVRAAGLMKIGGDLVVTAVTASATAAAGGSITVTDTTKNQGAATLSESATGFYLSPNNAFDSTDAFLGSRVVAPLGASQISTAATAFVIPPGTASGAYYVIAVADWNGGVAESTENNNTRGSGSVRIGPDLTVTGVTAPASAVAGTSVSVSDTTTNQGADTAPASVTSFYLSSNAVLDVSDELLATRAVASLGPGLSDAGSVALSIPAAKTAGTYYVIAKADGPNAMAEGAENNNTRPRLITIAAAP